MDRPSEEYTVRMRVKFTDIAQLTRFSTATSLMAERVRFDLTEGYIEELFEKHGCAEIDITVPSEIYFAEGSGGLQEIQTDLNAARVCGAEIELSMGWTKQDEEVQSETSLR